MTAAAASPAPRRPDAWHARLRRQVATHWPVKMVGTIVWIAGFFWLYFWVMRHPAAGSATRLMPVTWIDRLVDVHEWALLPYASLWFYVGLAPAFAKDRAELITYSRSAFVLCAGGLLFFWLVPTAVPGFSVDWNTYPALSFLKARDGGANAFPSLHVAFAVHSLVFIRRALLAVVAPLATHLANWAWAAVILWSVIATRQHVFVDVVGGIAAGMASLAFAREAWSGAGRSKLVAVPSEREH